MLTQGSSISTVSVVAGSSGYPKRADDELDDDLEEAAALRRPVMRSMSEYSVGRSQHDDDDDDQEEEEEAPSDYDDDVCDRETIPGTL